MTDPEWLEVARRYEGLSEIPGAQHNPRILRWWRAIGAPFRDDETSWCGAFVGGCLSEAGIVPAYPPRAWGARSWLRYGVACGPRLGAIVVFWRGHPVGWSGHVGFLVGRDLRRGTIDVCGGNQNDTVSIKPFPIARVLEGGYRWPGVNVAGHDAPLLDSGGEVSVNEA